MKIGPEFGLVFLLPMQIVTAADGVGTVQPLPLSQPSYPSPPELNVPNSPPLDGKPLSQQPVVFVKQIHLQGNTVFSESELASITEKFQNRKLSAEDLRQLRHELTLFYIDNGYINSGAILPEQKVENGALFVQIVEGRLTDVKLEGLEHLREVYLIPRIEKNTENQPLNIKTLQTDLQLIQQNPLIKRINAELTPGLRPGEALLRAKVEEANPWYLTLATNNLGVPSVGSERFETWAGHRNVLGFGDGFDGHFNVSAGQIQYDFNYGMPFTRWDSRFNVRYQKSEADVVEKPFDQLNIFNEMEAFAVWFSQPVWHTLADEATLSLVMERRHSQSFLLNDPFSFSRGSVDGASDVSVIRFSQDWLHRSASQVLAFRSVCSWGVDALGSTIHLDDPSLPDSNFFVWLGQMQWIQLLWDSGVEMVLRSDAQISASPLLSLEQFTLGGRYSVRGYRENQLVRDSGVSASLEFRIPIIANGMVKLAPFYDIGSAWNKGLSTPEPLMLHSAGIGVLVDPTRQVHAELYWAHAFVNLPHSSYNLQDDGINFAVSYKPF